MYHTYLLPLSLEESTSGIWPNEKRKYIFTFFSLSNLICSLAWETLQVRADGKTRDEKNSKSSVSFFGDF